MRFTIECLLILTILLNGVFSLKVRSSSLMMKSQVPVRPDTLANLILPSCTITLASVVLLPIEALADSSQLTAVAFARPALDIFINVMNLLFLARTVISWYPKTDLSQFPFNAIVWPTEPLLIPTRRLVPPQFGVDISAIVWIMGLSFIREVLIGPQGLLILAEQM